MVRVLLSVKKRYMAILGNMLGNDAFTADKVPEFVDTFCRQYCQYLLQEVCFLPSVIIKHNVLKLCSQAL